MRKSESRCPFCGTAARESYAVAAIVVGAMSVACGPSVTDDGDGGGGRESSGGSTTTTATATTVGASTRTDDVTSMGPSSTSLDTDSDTTDAESGGGFLYGGPDGDLPPAIECDVWMQDCPAPEKCAAWANDGGNVWNATRCVPTSPTPDEIGEECAVEGSAVSGVDTCGGGAMCFFVDSELGLGTCVELCGGSPADPLCDDAGTTCVIATDGVLNLCLDLCDPIAAQGCDPGEQCSLWRDVFACVPGTPGELAYGDACEDVDACAPGLHCVAGSNVPGCSEASCCTTSCDPTDPQADENCPDFADGQTCVEVEGTPYGICGVAP